jgi:hypothetical protein
MFQSGGWMDTIKQLTIALDRSLPVYTNQFAAYRTSSILAWQVLEDPLVMEYHQTVMALGIHRKGHTL